MYYFIFVFVLKPKAATFCSSQCPLKQQLQQAVSQAKPSGYSGKKEKVLCT
jgi:hypothetical protein